MMGKGCYSPIFRRFLPFPNTCLKEGRGEGEKKEKGGGKKKKEGECPTHPLPKDPSHSQNKGREKEKEGMERTLNDATHHQWGKGGQLLFFSNHSFGQGERGGKEKKGGKKGTVIHPLPPIWGSGRSIHFIHGCRQGGKRGEKRGRKGGKVHGHDKRGMVFFEKSVVVNVVSLIWGRKKKQGREGERNRVAFLVLALSHSFQI